ncbi:MAG: hypothetical protein ACI4SV_00505 [Duodenibacillus sp.]
MSRFPSETRPPRWSQTSLVLTQAEEPPKASSPAEPSEPTASAPVVEMPGEPPVFERAPYMSIALDVERRRRACAKTGA